MNSMLFTTSTSSSHWSRVLLLLSHWICFALPELYMQMYIIVYFHFENKLWYFNINSGSEVMSVPKKILVKISYSKSFKAEMNTSTMLWPQNLLSLLLPTMHCCRSNRESYSKANSLVQQYGKVHLQSDETHLMQSII